MYDILGNNWKWFGLSCSLSEHSYLSTVCGAHAGRRCNFLYRIKIFVIHMIQRLLLFKGWLCSFSFSIMFFLDCPPFQALQYTQININLYYGGKSERVENSEDVLTIQLQFLNYIN